MNDEPSSSSSASASAAPPAANDGTRTPPSTSQIALRRAKNRENFNRRRGDLLDDLLWQLDVLVYAELSAIYYMDCSTLLLLLRGLLQFCYLTPKSALFPAPPRSTPFTLLILASNLLCMFLHLVRAAPRSWEGEDRGYLHGGLILDFVGQKGPSSKLMMLCLDLLVLGLQVVQISAGVLREKLKATPGAELPSTVTTQGIEEEERGVLRSEEVERSQDVEMLELNPGTGRSEEVVSTTTTTAAMERTDAHIFDAFNSGQIVLADLDLGRTIREEGWLRAKAGPEDVGDGRLREQRAEMIARLRRRLGWS